MTQENPHKEPASLEQSLHEAPIDHFSKLPLINDPKERVTHIAPDRKIFSFGGLNFDMTAWIHTKRPQNRGAFHETRIIIAPDDVFYNGTSPALDIPRTPKTHSRSVDHEKIQHARAMLRLLSDHIEEEYGYTCTIQEDTVVKRPPASERNSEYITGLPSLAIRVEPDKLEETLKAIQNVLIGIEESYSKSDNGTLGPITVPEFTFKQDEWTARIANSESNQMADDIMGIVRETFHEGSTVTKYDFVELQNNLNRFLAGRAK